jgi:uncharacterized protein (DUF58 family)
MKLTPRGVGLLLAGPALLVTGFLLGYPELTVLGSACLLAVILGVTHAVWRPRLSVARAADPDRVMRGEASRVTLSVRNASRLRAATLVAHDRCGPRLVPVPLLRLRPGSDTVVDYPVPTDRRGVVDLGPLRVQRRDPLGLTVVSRTHGEVNRVWVYPKAHPLAAVPVGIVRSLDGRVDRVPHGSITFDTLREYVIGDELRHVHWRTTARVGELMVREHVDTALPRLVVLLDDRRSAHTADSFEAACEAAASIVLAAHREELPLAVQLVSGELVGGDGRRHTDTRDYLDLLAEAELTGTGPTRAGPGGDGGGALDGAIRRLRMHRLGDTLIFLTGAGRPADLGQIGTLRGAYPSIVAGTLGSAEPTPVASAGLLVLAATDGEDFAATWDGVRTW